MLIELEELTNFENTERQIVAMGHSVDLINRLIAGGEHTEEIHDTIDRNVRHLEIMLSKENIQNSGHSLTSFETAIIEGNIYIATSI